MRQIISLTELKSTSAGKRRDNQHLFDDKVKQKRQKYSNAIVEFDGFIFRSKKELGQYVILRAREKAGEIADLQLQVPFELNPSGTHSVKYVTDFLYRELKTGELIAEDAKGKSTKLFDKKEKLMRELYGIHIKLS